MLLPGQSLSAGQSKKSCDKRFELAMQTDNNLVLYGPPGALWSTNSVGTGANAAVMQSDGNFVLYAPGGAPKWDSKTGGKAGAYLAIQDDGNMVVYLGGAALWNSKTCCY